MRLQPECTSPDHRIDAHLWPPRKAEAAGIIVEILLDEEKPLDSETLERARKDIEANQRDEHEVF